MSLENLRHRDERPLPEAEQMGLTPTIICSTWNTEAAARENPDLLKLP